MTSEPLADADARGLIRTATNETLFVEAGAGSGKTHSLVERVATLVLDVGEPIERIATVTFTERAGAELRDRLRARFEQALREEAGDRRDLAEAALDGLDAAAIGTLHSFAQRILTSYPIQAGLPPLIEVLDEVASSVQFDRQWANMQRALLDDPDMSERILLALASGIKLDELRALARAFSNDWDLIEEHVPDSEPPALRLPDVAHLVRQVEEIARATSECSNDADLFLAKLSALAEWGKTLADSSSDADRFAALAKAADLKWGHGSAKNWSDLPGLKLRCQDLQARAKELQEEFQEATLRPLAHWIARRVLLAARTRAEQGTLEFHDLLVLSRELLRTRPEVREELRQAYPRLLLDEFQDTDPIQIDLAHRIAAGVNAGEEGWEGVTVPPGSLFVVGDPKQSIYRFRRASISTYLRAQEHLAGPGADGRQVALTTNFRTVAAILDWVNAVFGSVIEYEPGGQPHYQPLAVHRTEVGHGPAVSVLGAVPHLDKLSAAELREREGSDVAGAIARALAEQWTVWDTVTEMWRPLTLGDITVLIPARTSLPYLEDALDAAGIPYRTESSSLVYQAAEVRNLMAAARALADPSDLLSCVTALRSSLFGCGDDDLYRYKRARGSFNLQAPVAEELADTPVGQAMTYLRSLHYRSRWLSPSEILTALIVDRRVLEVSATGPRARDSWRRIRFIVDQARAWSEVEHGGLREYLAWASRQADESSRVAESVLPETDMDVVRIMTVHAAKGLEFGMVVLSGMTSQPNRRKGVQLLWTGGGEGSGKSFAVRLNARLQTNDFTEAQPLDEQMDDLERRRLLYVATTRARDHLVVSLHRNTRNLATAKGWTSAEILAETGHAASAGAELLELESAEVPPHPGEAVLPLEQSEEEWAEWLERSRAESRKVWVRSPSGLEGTEPEVVLLEGNDWVTAGERGGERPQADEKEAPHLEPGDAKGPRDLELPPWEKGRYGNLIGRAVHGVLQTIDLATGEGLGEAVAAQCLAEGATEHKTAVEGLVRSALASDLVRRAADREHWRETFVGRKDGEGVVEGFTDLIFRDDDRSLVIVDYKTDSVPDAAIPSRVAHYAPQQRAYVEALEAATGERAGAVLLFLKVDGSPPIERSVSA